jgi:hypothetical protein
MNNLYHKVAIASICTALSFALGANKEAKAAIFTLTGPSIGFGVEGFNVGERFSSGGISVKKLGGFRWESDTAESRAFYEFNMGTLSFASDTIISRAILNLPFSNLEIAYRTLFLDLFGYVGNGMPNLSDFNAGVRIGTQDAVINYPPDPQYYPPYLYYYRTGTLKFDVTNFVNQRINNGDNFAGFGIRVFTSDNNNYYPNYGSASLPNYPGSEPSLIIETVDVGEPVPEPTTIFGSAIVLGVGGWLKRKKSNQQNKTTSQQ